ncbi:aminodeoxychorismate synthase component I [Niveibacterium terrae]|uniref:aminodeoxychorismate synthase component I n=1 Tax=Niveibacterium terrae TaxID=3373598 RepID=UPI003A916216
MSPAFETSFQSAEPGLPEWLSAKRPCALFEDNQSGGGARLLFDLERTLCAWTSEEVPGLLAEIDRLAGQGQWIALAASYELGYALSPRLHSLMPAHDRPLLEAWVWRRGEHLDAHAFEATLAGAQALLSSSERTSGVTDLKASLSEAEHARGIAAIQAQIEAGECYQINYTFPLSGHAYGDPLALYARLRQAQPVRYGALIRHARGALLSRSPELFVERKGQCLRSRPMKGTAPLGQAETLRASEKDRAENLMIVDLLRNDMARLCPPGGVRVEELFRIEDYASLHQMTSTITASPCTASLAEIFAALFPCGSITGAPKIRAMELIRELEPAARGLYCGALGWIAPGGDFCFNVPIRTLEIGSSGDFTMGLGGGIVADSLAASEYAECLTKGRFLSELGPGFELFETLLRNAQGDYPRLDRHLRRLARSADELGFPFAEDAAREMLQSEAEHCQGLPRRVRLSLDTRGQLKVSGSALPPLPPAPKVTLSRRILSTPRWLLGHKTSARALYDSELAHAVEAGHFDVLFLNEEGELCEGARSNVYLEKDGQLLTPPLSSGLLPGVMREELIEQGLAREKRLGLKDLAAAQRVFVSNALRGLVEVGLVL